ncbi:MAG: hypothetical protein H0U65_15520 [Rubrobacter sp.]|nr:hypothetical protein [Rubrobacter sp.]
MVRGHEVGGDAGAERPDLAEAEGQFVSAIASMEFYGEAGRIVRYLIDTYSARLCYFSSRMFASRFSEMSIPPAAPGLAANLR